jgi:outer membrane immunogenic protein
MSKSSKLFVIFLAIATFCVSAQAQSHGSTSDYTFRGFYVGANVGGTWMNGDTGFTPLPDVPTFFSLKPTTLSPDPSGFMGGGQAGYNWVADNSFMFGLETDMQGASLDGTQTVTPIIQSDGSPAGAGSFLQAHSESNWLGTLRARAGFVAGERWLIYGTGGMAYGHVAWNGQTNYLAGGGCCIYAAAFDDNKVGWTAGGGIEYLVGQHWSLGAEYLYVDLGDERFAADSVPPNPPLQVQYNVNSIFHVVRGKLNFKF